MWFKNWNVNTHRQLSHVTGIPVFPFKKENEANYVKLNQPVCIHHQFSKLLG